MSLLNKNYLPKQWSLADLLKLVDR
ncbi:hypothetical protein AB3S75_046968 [Citrus x aurantiifolia]